MTAADDSPTGDRNDPGLRPPEHIGPYRVLEKIGDGGMGSVFVAEQREPVHRRVAVKVIKPGMDSAEVLARFSAERQALALMDHPNIARVFDAGVDARQRPYFAMELVRGEELTTYCDKARLGLRERLELFVAVCAGVAHAHQKGIIHRDLKPANVLVTLVDGQAMPKIIDFGVAKAMDQRLTEQTVYTQLGALLGTLEYMSPEQADQGGLDIDTRSDVYSLGVILYELLVGLVPTDRAELLQHGYGELRRHMREHTPVRPSTRVSTAGPAATTIADRRKVDHRALARHLRGELDWITMRALEPERERRYQSVTEFALDVRRYLAGEAVAAGPPSVSYRLRKVVRRHRGAVAAAAMVLLALCAGLAVAVLGWREAADQAERARASEAAALADRERATAAEVRASGEARRATEVVALIDEMVGLADPHQTRLPGYTMRQLLDDFSGRLGDRLAGQPLVEATLRGTMGRAYLGLGLAEAAAPHLQRAQELVRREHGDDSLAAAKAALDLADLEHCRGAYTAATERTAAVLRLLEPERQPDGRPLPELERALCQLLDYARHQGRIDEAEALAERALQTTVALRGADDPAVGMRKSDLGTLREMRNDYAGAETLYRDAAALLEAGSGADAPATIAARGRLGTVLLVRGAVDEARPMLERYLQDQEAAFGPDSAEVIPPLLSLGLAHTYGGDAAAGEQLLRRASRLVDANGGEQNINFASSRCQLGVCLQAQKRWQESIPWLRAAREFLLGRYGPGHPEVATVTQNLANSYLGVDRPEEAVSAFEEAAAGFAALHVTSRAAHCVARAAEVLCQTEPTRLPALLGKHRACLEAAVIAAAAPDAPPDANEPLPLLADAVLLGAAGLGDAADALALVRTLRALLEPVAAREWIAVVDREHGRWLQSTGDDAAAEQVWTAAHRRVADRPQRRNLARLLARDLAALCLAQGRADDAVRWRALADDR